MSDLQRVGPVFGGTGTAPPFTADVTGAQRVGDAHGRYFDATTRGSVWTIATATAGITVTALMVIGVASSVPIVGVHNPAGSGRYAVVGRAAVLVPSGTMGAGGFVWGIIAPTSTNTTNVGTNGAINNATFAAGGSIVRTFAGATPLTATGATVLFRTICGPSTGAVAANAASYTMEETAGDICVPPGGFLGIFASTAGTSPIVNAFLTWEEVPLFV